jgi:hypothetical protein
MPGKGTDMTDLHLCPKAPPLRLDWFSAGGHAADAA